MALAPVTRAEARRLIEGLRGAALLKGFRGMPAVDIDGLAELVQRVAELAADQAGQIAEIDVNPVICHGARLLAVDALMARSAPHG